MNNNISEFYRFSYKEENFHDIRDYCDSNNIWICQSLRMSGPMTFALARSREVASDLNARFS
jgi:hypothetical protein